MFVPPVLHQLVKLEVKSSADADSKVQEECAPGKPFSVFTAEQSEVSGVLTR